MKSGIMLMIGIAIGILIEHYTPNIEKFLFDKTMPVEKTQPFKGHYVPNTDTGKYDIVVKELKPCERPLKGCYLASNDRGEYVVKVGSETFVIEYSHSKDFGTFYEPDKRSIYKDSCEAKAMAFRYIEHNRWKKSFKFKKR